MFYRVFSAFLLIYFASPYGLFSGSAAEMHHEKLDLVYYNKDYVKDPYFSISEIDGKFGVNVSFDLLKDLGMHVKLNVNITYRGEDTNEYVPLQNLEDIDFCDVVKSDMFGVRKLMTLANITDCPWKAGHYKMLDIKGDSSELPPLPSGSYKTAISIRDDVTVLAEMLWMGTATE